MATRNLVGIGTTDPQYTLDIAGDLNVTGGLFSNGQDASGALYWTETAGENIVTSVNVGIGVTGEPEASLHVGGNTRIEGNLTVNGTQTIVNTNIQETSRIEVTNNGTGPAVIVNQTGLQPIANFQDDGVSALFIADGGNVGIGTSNPSDKLTVNGDLKSTGTVYAGTFSTTGSMIANSISVNGLVPEIDPSLSFDPSIGSLQLTHAVGGLAPTVEITSDNGNILLNPDVSGSNFPSQVFVTGGVNISSGSSYKVNGTDVLTSTALGSGVTSSSLTSVGTLSSLDVAGSIDASTLNINGVAEWVGTVYTVSGTWYTTTIRSSRITPSSITIVGVGHYRIGFTGATLPGKTAADSGTFLSFNSRRYFITGFANQGVVLTNSDSEWLPNSIEYRSRVISDGSSVTSGHRLQVTVLL